MIMGSFGAEWASQYFAESKVNECDKKKVNFNIKNHGIIVDEYFLFCASGSDALIHEANFYLENRVYRWWFAAA